MNELATRLGVSGATARRVIPRMTYAENVRDAVATAGAVLLEAGRLAAERIGQPAGLPRNAAEIRAGWLSAALQTDFPGAHVESLRRISRQSGTTDRARLAVTYNRLGGGARPPASVFVKVTPADTRVRLFVNLLRLAATEVQFHQQIAPDLGIERPRVFHARYGGPGGRFVLLCEDLVARGVRFGDGAGSTTLEEARLVVRELARLHASLWDSPRFELDLAWLKGRRRGPRRRAERFFCKLAIASAARAFADLVPAALPARILSARDALEEAWARPPLTLIHGDAQAANLYFLSDTAGFFDWQLTACGQGMRDVSTFLGSSLPVDLRRQHERALIAFYLDALRRNGVAAPDLDTAWEQHRLHAVHAWISAAFSAGALTRPAERVVRTGLERATQAVLDLGSLGALDALVRAS